MTTDTAVLEQPDADHLLATVSSVYGGRHRVPDRVTAAVHDAVRRDHLAGESVVPKDAARIGALLSGWRDASVTDVVTDFDAVMARFPAERLLRSGVSLTQVGNVNSWWLGLTTEQQAAQAEAWEAATDSVVAASAAAIPAAPIIGLDPSVLAALDVRYQRAGAPGMAPTDLKTANYTTPGNEIVRFDLTAASRTLGLPLNPADGTQVGARIDATDTKQTHTLTINTGGSADVFGKTGGSTSLTLVDLDESVVLQYRLAEHLWVVIEHGWSKSGLLTENAKSFEQVIVAQGAGIDPTGNLDSTAALQAFINTAVTNANTGGIATGPITVYIPPGQYKVTTLNIDSDRVQIEGAGPYSTVLISISTTAHVFNFGNGSTVRYYNAVRRLRIGAAFTRTAGAAIYLNNVGRCTFEEVNLDNQFIGYSINGALASAIWIVRAVWGNFAPNGVGCDIQGGNDHYLTGIAEDNPFAAQPKCGVRIGATAGTWITDCDFIHSGEGLLINPASGQVAEFLFAQNTGWDFGTGGSGIHINPAAGGGVYSIQFVGCWTSSFTGHGIFTDPSGGGTINGVKFVGHRSLENGLAGFNHSAGVNVSVLDSDLGGNSEVSHGGTVGGNHGMYVLGGVSNWSVINCRLKPTGTDNNNQAYGLFIDAGASDHYRILGNDVTGNVTGGITDLGTGTNKLIRNNDGYQAPWTTYTPVMTGSGWAIGNGTITGSFIQFEHVMHFTIKITFGSTSTYGSSVAPSLSLPVAGVGVNEPFTAVLDNAGVRYSLVARRGTVSTVQVNVPDKPWTNLTATNPVALASGMILTIRGTYQV